MEALPCKTCLVLPSCLSRYNLLEKKEAYFPKTKTMFEACNPLLIYIYTDTSVSEREERKKEFYKFFKLETVQVVFIH